MGKRLYQDAIPLGTKLRRLLWSIAYGLLFRLSPKTGFNGWRIFLLRLFGATIGSGCRIAPTCRIWHPCNLDLGDQVCLAEEADIYCVGKIQIGSNVTISQRAYLCTASHDISRLERPLIVSNIQIGSHAWVCAEAFVGPNVSIGEGAVVGARAVVCKDVDPWSVVVGNPGVAIRKRTLIQSNNLSAH